MSTALLENDELVKQYISSYHGVTDTSLTYRVSCFGNIIGGYSDRLIRDDGQFDYSDRGRQCLGPHSYSILNIYCSRSPVPS